MSKLRISTEWYAQDCIRCSAPFAVLDTFNNRRRNDHQVFWCPACGQSMCYTGKSDVQKAKDLAEKHRLRAEHMENQRDQSRRQLDHANRSRAALKGVLTKTKRRVKNGVCPCCNRHFKNLERHMRGQHPDYGDKIERSEP